jgi:hypothetical protein
MLHSSRLVAGLLATVVALSACSGNQPPDVGPRPAPTLAEVTLAETTVGASYSSSIGASGGQPPYTFSAQGLPPGLILGGDSGALTGTPTAAGDFQVQLTVRDTQGQQASKAYAIKVYPAVSFKQSTLPPASLQAPYNATLELEGGKAPLTVRLSGGDLPSGISFSATRAQLSGTPSATGTNTFTFEATDVHGAKTAQSYTLTVAEALRFNTVALPVGNLNQPYSTPISASGGRAPLTLSVDSGALPAGMTLSGGVLSGTPTTSGSFPLVLKVTDAQGVTATASFTLVIYSHVPPRLSSSTLPPGAVGKAYSHTVAVTDGAPPFTLLLTQGTLPAGLQLSTAGVLSGTPTTVETQSFQVLITDSNGQTGTGSLTVTIYPTLQVQTSALTEGYQGHPYTHTLAASGGLAPYRWEAQGALPAGLSLTAAGVLSGTPTTAGAYGLAFTLTDSSGQVATASFPLTIYTLPTLTTAVLGDGAVGSGYSQRLRATGGKPPYSFAVIGGVLPDGLRISGDTITGTPTTGVISNVTIQVTDANGKSSSQDYDLRVFDGVTILTGALDDAYVGRSYTLTFTAGGGDQTRAYTWAPAGALPAGLSLSPAGVLSGTPTTAGTQIVNVQVTDASNDSTSRAFDLRVFIPPSVSTSSLPDAFVGVAYSATLSGTGGLPPYQWRVSVGALPSGMTLSSSGVLSGVPDTAGTATFTVELTDANGVLGTRGFTIPISRLSITSTTLVDGYVGQPYSQALAASGGPTPFSWSATGLPNGLSLDANTGLVSGTAVAAGTTTVSVSVTDAFNRVATKDLPLSLYALPQITTTAMAPGYANVAYTQPLEAINGKPPHSWSLSVGSLHAGLTFGESAGVWAVRGTPTQAGTRTLTFVVTDANGKQASRSFDLTVAAALALTTTTLPDAYEGKLYDQSLAATGGKPTYTFDRAAGAIPGGLSLSPAGRLSGTVATGATSSTFIARVTDANSTQASRSLTIAVYRVPSISISGYPEGYVNEAYNALTPVSGGKAPLTWSLDSGTLPPGLALNSTTGQLSGTPTQDGTFSFTLRVRDVNGEQSTRQLGLILYTLPAVTSPSVLPGTYAGDPYSFSITADGGKPPLVFSLSQGALPTGLTLASNGQVAGTVSSSVPHGATSLFTVLVRDANGRQASKPMELTSHRPPEILSTSLTPATEGVSYRRSEASPERIQSQYGRSPITYTSSPLPAGLSLDSATGVLSGTPAQGTAGVHPIIFTVTDAGARSVTTNLALQVLTPKPVPYGGVVGLAPFGSRITGTLTVFTTDGRSPLAGVGVRVRKNGQEYSPTQEALTNAEGKAVFTGLGLNGTTDTVDITANGKELINTTLAQVNASLVTLRLYPLPLPGPRLQSSGAHDPSTGRFLITGGTNSSNTNSLFFSTCFNDVVEPVDVAQKNFRTTVPAGLSTAPPARYAASMAIAGGVAVLFGGSHCIDTADPLGDTWELNLTTHTWTQVNSTLKPTPRRGAAMVREPSGNTVLLVGGIRDPSYSNQVWRYTPATDTWTQLGAAPFSRAWMASALHSGTGELWFCGGNDAATGSSACHAFNPSTQTWTTKPSLPSARYEFSMAYDPVTESLYAYGGRNQSGTLSSELLVLRKGAAAWQILTVPGATPGGRRGHVMYFDTARSELVLALGLTTDPVTSSSVQPGDVWTYNGTAWTQRGTPAPTAAGYTVSGQISGGPAGGWASVHAVSSSGFRANDTLLLDAQGSGVYMLPLLPPGDSAVISALVFDYSQPFPNELRTSTDALVPPLTADVTVNLTLPPAPVASTQSTLRFLLPASWLGVLDYAFADPELSVPGLPGVLNGAGAVELAGATQLSVAYVPPAAPRQQRMNAYVSSRVTCEDQGFFLPLAPGSQDLTVGGTSTGLSPGQAECIPSGPAGVGAPRRGTSAARPEQVTVGYLDADAFPDMVFTSTLANGVDITWGGPNFTSTRLTLAGGRNHSSALGDFNQDGKMDVAVTDTTNGAVQVYLATAHRSFASGVSYPVGANLAGIAAADVTQDGVLDLLVARKSTNTVELLRGLAGGTFGAPQPVSLAGGTSPSAVVVSHLDGDTLPDLVVTVAEGLAITLDGTTQPPFGTTRLINANSQPSAVAVAQLTADTVPDLVVANPALDGFSVIEGVGGGIFGGPLLFYVGQDPTGLFVAELTGDAHLDLALTHPTEGMVTVIRGASNGGFAVHSRTALWGDPRGVAAADFNADGLNDLAVTSSTINFAYVLAGQRPLPAGGGAFSFTAPTGSGFMWAMHAIHGQRRYWDYYSPIQAGAVSYALPAPSTLAPSSAPPAPASGKMALNWSPRVRKWEPNSSRPFNPNQFSLQNLGFDTETQAGPRGYLWP